MCFSVMKIVDQTSANMCHEVKVNKTFISWSSNFA